MADQTDNILLLPNEAPYEPRVPKGDDTIVLSKAMRIMNNLTVTGILQAEQLNSVQTDTIRTSDRFISLNDGYRSMVPHSTGIVAIHSAADVAHPITQVLFEHGEGLQGACVFFTRQDGGEPFAPGDIFAVSGTEHNDGIYETEDEDEDGILLCIEQNPQGPWIQDNFVQELVTGQGYITKVNIFVMVFGDNGEIRVGFGNQSPISFKTIADIEDEPLSIYSSAGQLFGGGKRLVR